MRALIKDGRVIDPANNMDEVCDVLVEDAKIAEVGKHIRGRPDTVINATGKIVMPGIVDMHVHLREPGREDKETVETGTQAALRGGVTSVLAMPNTSPAIDCEKHIKLLKAITEKTAKVEVFICGAITKERRGQELTDIPTIKREGAVALTDDGSSVDSPEVLREALRCAKKEDVLVICHCEDKALSAEGVVNLGLTSTRMGLRGISKESEYSRVKRNIDLAEEIDVPIHIAHVSCAETVDIIAKAKRKGVKVTADTAPHYFALWEEEVVRFDTNMKMNPPLRSRDDAIALRQALKEGTIDAIASDHAPHTENEKEIEFERAEFGVTGLETELAVSITELVHGGTLDWSLLVAKMATNPARILGIKKGTLSIGADADITIVAPQREWAVRKEGFASKSRNCAFLGKTLKGMVEYTIHRGTIAYQV